MANENELAAASLTEHRARLERMKIRAIVEPLAIAVAGVFAAFAPHDPIFAAFPAAWALAMAHGLRLDSRVERQATANFAALVAIHGSLPAGPRRRE